MYTIAKVLLLRLPFRRKITYRQVFPPILLLQ